MTRKYHSYKLFFSIKEPATSPNTTNNIIGNQSCVKTINMFIKKLNIKNYIYSFYPKILYPPKQ